MSEFFDAADQSRVKQKTALVMFVIVFALFAIFVMVNVLARESNEAAKEKSNPDQVIELLEAN